jgi:hypothetical protein
MSEEQYFKVGDHVYKTSGDYKFDGIVVAVFPKLSGKVRLVVEDDRGILHIFSPQQMEKINDVQGQE